MTPARRPQGRCQDEARHHRRGRSARRPAERSGAGQHGRQDRVRRPAERGRLPVIEVSAFVSPKWVPQMADAAEVFAGISRQPGTRYTALVPNLAGLDRAVSAGRRRDRDLRRRVGNLQPEEHQSEHRRVAGRLRQVCDRALAQGLARSRLPVHRLRMSVRRRRAGGSGRRRTVQLLEMGVFEVAVSDTIGIAHPGQVPRSRRAAAPQVPIERLALHFHDTRGTALANVLAGLLAGVRTFDASAGGLGGCPYAPGAAGNLATDDLVYMLDGLGVRERRVADRARRGGSVHREAGGSPASLTLRAGAARVELGLGGGRLGLRLRQQPHDFFERHHVDGVVVRRAAELALLRGRRDSRASRRGRSRCKDRRGRRRPCGRRDRVLRRCSRQPGQAAWQIEQANAPKQ